VDEFTEGIDFLAELEKDEKMYIDELQQITEKIDLPLYDFVTGNDGSQGDYNKLSKTEQLLEEFDSIYDAVELDHLTPPQTPPEQKIFLSSGGEESQQFVQNIPIEQQQFVFDYQQPQQQEQYIYLQDGSTSTPVEQEIAFVYENSNHSMMSSDEGYNSQEIIIDPEPIISSPADLQLEMEVVDEIIQAHSRSQFDYDDDNSTVCTSSSWSPRSDYSASNYSQDDEPVTKSSSLHGVTKKRTRPYGRNPDEKKFRKKEQNKNAATRYRQKKKEEVGVILSEERILMDKNKKLATSYNDTKREVKYLKSLLRELFQARGFVQ
jgi:cyclic AMP-dependent transcription factor ATF-4